MCGIIGINSNKEVSSPILSSLRKLEYRGYDSAGIATLNNGYIQEVKCEGRVDNLEKNIVNSIQKTLKSLHGSFALGIIFKDQPDLIVGARRGSPLAVGYGPNENYLGSDSYALKSMTNKITYLNDGEFCIIKQDHVEFFSEEGIKINKKVLELSSAEEKYDKGDYKHFMAKEIEEQPNTIRNGINEYIDMSNKDISIYNFPWKSNEKSSITLIGCGTAYHSCLLAKYWVEEITTLDVNIDITSEFRYRKNRLKKETLYVFVSQSGLSLIHI